MVDRVRGTPPTLGPSWAILHHGTFAPRYVTSYEFLNVFAGVRMGISAREFARRDGCSDTLVRRAGKNGKLKVSADGMYDEAQVGSDWRPRDRDVRTGRANTTANIPSVFAAAEQSAPSGLDEESQPPDWDAARMTFAEAIRLKEAYTAKLKHLDFEIKSGSLISADTAANVLFQEFRNARDAWLNWPTSIAPHMAAELGIEPDKLVEVLTRYVHEHLAELGEPAGQFGPSDGKASAGGPARMDAPTTH